MRQGLKLLVLAGSAEARQIAAMARDAGAQVRALVSEPPRGSNPMPVPCDLIPFDDQSVLCAAMAGADAVLDASHGFDDAMSRAGLAAARALGLPSLAYRRPAWTIGGRPRWHSAPDVTAAMALVAPDARVFSATGWASLPEYADFPGALLLLRQTIPHDRAPPFPFVQPVFGDPPFTRESEIALFRLLEVDTLICRNLGGRASRPKLDAAEALGLSVILIDRPPLPPDVAVVDTVAAMMGWVEAQ